MLDSAECVTMERRRGKKDAEKGNWQSPSCSLKVQFWIDSSSSLAEVCSVPSKFTFFTNVLKSYQRHKNMERLHHQHSQHRRHVSENDAHSNISTTSTFTPSMTLNPTSTIEDIIEYVIGITGLTKVPELDPQSLARESKQWATKLKSHMIFTHAQLLRIPPSYLHRLDLPLLIEAELERLLRDVRILSLPYSCMFQLKGGNVVLASASPSLFFLLGLSYFLSFFCILYVFPCITIELEHILSSPPFAPSTTSSAFALSLSFSSFSTLPSAFF